MSPSHFLAPLDFSEHADHALEYAIGLAQALQARLTLLHVIHTPAWAGGEFTAQMTDLERDAEHALEPYCRRIQAAALEGTYMVRQGIPWHEIVEVAKQRHVDLILMSTHGYTGLQHVLLGSVAERVVRHAPCPVLVTRQSKSAR